MAIAPKSGGGAYSQPVVLIGLAFADAPTHFLAINRDSSSRSK